MKIMVLHIRYHTNLLMIEKKIYYNQYTNMNADVVALLNLKEFCH